MRTRPIQPKNEPGFPTAPFPTKTEEETLPWRRILNTAIPGHVCRDDGDFVPGLGEEDGRGEARDACAGRKSQLEMYAQSGEGGGDGGRTR